MHPCCRFYDDYNTYKNRCKIDDTFGYSALFETDDVIEPLDVMVAEGPVNDEFLGISTDNDDIEKETEELDSVKKYQYIYNKSLFMSEKYPEITVAPGEGQIPIDTLKDHDWDIKCFPHLHNFDGSNGLFQEREVKLTEQYYFIQRICNKEKRFSKCSPYVYAAVANLEKKRIQSNLSLCGTRGKAVSSDSTANKYEINDAFRSLENVNNTPKFWQKKKYELLAKIDNLGPFHIFFTLSCADLRWNANFAAILLDIGYHIKYKVLDDDIIIEAKTENGEWQSLDDILKSEVGKTHHELIRGNVIIATRYFQHRVKSFLNKIVLNNKNPLSVKHYSYRVEFQERGAGHIHGTLWLDMNKLENLVISENGCLKLKDEKCAKESPFKGIKVAFNKLKLREHLDKQDQRCLTSLIDSFSSVSLHPGSVGKDVAIIASSVNKHHHTKTCHKYNGTCRFEYSKPPSPYTIVAQPSPDKIDTKLMAKYKKIIDSVRNITNDTATINEIMAEYDKEKESIDEYKKNKAKRIKAVCKLAGVEYKEYLKALSTTKSGNKIILSRDIDETYINPYNVEWLRSWDGNMDIQFVLDYFAVVTYVTEYYLKPDSGTMEVLNAAVKQCDSSNLKERMKAAANKFLSHRQIGEAEAIYRLIPSMTLAYSSITCQWVATGKKASMKRIFSVPFTNARNSCLLVVFNLNSIRII